MLGFDCQHLATQHPSSLSLPTTRMKHVHTYTIRLGYYAESPYAASPIHPAPSSPEAHPDARWLVIAVFVIVQLIALLVHGPYRVPSGCRPLSTLPFIALRKAAGRGCTRTAWGLNTFISRSARSYVEIHLEREG